MPRNVLVFAALIAALGMFLTLLWPDPEPGPEPAEARAVPSQPSEPTPPQAGSAAARPAAPVPSAATAPSAEADKPAEQAAAPSDTPSGFKDMIETDQGPVGEYQRRYDSETRDSAAQTFETHIRAAFMQGNSAELLHSVSCRETICRMLMRWSPKRTLPYVEAMKRIGLGGEPNPDRIGFDLPVALSPVGTKDSDGVRTVEVYLKRR